MSYDLTVFRTEIAPKTREKFISWFVEQAKWEEGHGYQDPAITSPELRNWFMEMKQTFPALNGPFACDDQENVYVADYCIGKDLIYVGFAWSVAEQAYYKMKELAEKHNLGFYDTSAEDGDILFPTEDGKLKRIDKLDNLTSIEQIKNIAKEGQEGKSVMEILFSKLNISGFESE